MDLGLYLVHCRVEKSDTSFELFVVAEGFDSAKQKVLKMENFDAQTMSILRIQNVEMVGGHRIYLEEEAPSACYAIAGEHY